MNGYHYSALIVAVMCLSVSMGLAQRTAVLNGFVIEDPLFPYDQIRAGGPQRDGIPPIESPHFVSTADAAYLKPTDRVLGVSLNGETKAYPIHIMNYHEVVNDKFGNQLVSITYCPLCGSGIAIEGKAGRIPTTFGVSGLLYNSDVLLYDRETESLWSQIFGKAINGPLKGEELIYLPSTNTTWEAWKSEHPETLVLSYRTGFTKPYDRYPYGEYQQTGNLYFPVSHRDMRFHPKEWVLGIEVNGVSKAYPFSRLRKKGIIEMKDEIKGSQIVIRYDEVANSAQAFDLDGEKLESITLFWFAWVAFHPATKVWKK